MIAPESQIYMALSHNLSLESTAFSRASVQMLDPKGKYEDSKENKVISLKKRYPKKRTYK